MTHRTADGSTRQPGTLRAGAQEELTGAQLLAEFLAGLGARHAFGLLGSAIAPQYEALGRAGLQVVHTRHEAGAVFMATEANLASGELGVVFSTTGPGLANTLIGLIGAGIEGAKVVVVAAATDAARLGHAAFQETGPSALRMLESFPMGSAQRYGAYVDSEATLLEALDAVARGVRQPSGFVGLLLMPLGAQNLRVAARPSRSSLSQVPRSLPSESLMEECRLRLSAAPFVVWCGSGAVSAASHVRELVERTGARVMCTPRAKGVLPEDHPQYLGVTGLGGHARVARLLAAARPAHVLTLGSRLGEMDSYFDPALTPAVSMIHVDLDSRAFGQVFPAIPVLGVRASVADFLSTLTPRLPQVPISPWTPLAPPQLDPTPSVGALPAEGLHPRLVMEALQRVVVERSDATIMTEAGNAFAWTSHALRFDRPGRYRVSTSWGAMGHFTSGVVGHGLATGRAAVAVVGDGAMAMLDETSTAAAFGVPAVWVVLNDARYGMLEHGMRAVGLTPRGLAFPRIDFARVARAKGCVGLTVDTVQALEPALEEALAAKGPVVLDVRIDARVAPPFGRRNDLLRTQGLEA